MPLAPRNWLLDNEFSVTSVVCRIHNEFIQSLDKTSKDLKRKLGYILATIAIEGLESVLQRWLSYNKVLSGTCFTNTPQIVYKVAICLSGNLPYIQITSIVLPYIRLTYKRSVV